MKLLHIAHREPVAPIFSRLFIGEVERFGELTLVSQGCDMSDADKASLIRQCDVLLTGWGMATVPADIAKEPGSLRYICHISGSLRGLIPLEAIEAGIPVTNWGDAPANGVAEGAMALLLGTVKELHLRIGHIERGGWRLNSTEHGGTLDGLNVGVYGFGAIGRRFVDLLRPFGSIIRIYDPYVTEIPEDCLRVDSLQELFQSSDAIVIHAGLCEGTVGSVTAELLAMLPDQGVVINTARGGIIDQDALFAELESGRLSAGLDVLEPDSLPEGHPARRWENLILSAHCIEHIWPLRGREQSKLTYMQKVCLDNLQRFSAGEPLRFVMDQARYELST